MRDRKGRPSVAIDHEGTKRFRERGGSEHDETRAFLLMRFGQDAASLVSKRDKVASFVRHEHVETSVARRRHARDVLDERLDPLSPPTRTEPAHGAP